MLRLTVRDDASGITNTDGTISVVIRCARSISSAGAPGSVTYQVNAAAVAVAMPTYASSPSICMAILTFEIVESSDGLCKPWFSCAPDASSQIILSTTDNSFVGSHTLKIKVIEQSTGVVDDSVAFSV